MSKKYFFFCRIIILSGYLLDYFGWNLLCAKPTDLDTLRQVVKVDKHLQLDNYCHFGKASLPEIEGYQIKSLSSDLFSSDIESDSIIQVTQESMGRNILFRLLLNY